jgi:hypothetical protein
LEIDGFEETIKRLSESVCFQLSELDCAAITPAVSAELYVELAGKEEIEPIRK